MLRQYIAYVCRVAQKDAGGATVPDRGMRMRGNTLLAVQRRKIEHALFYDTGQKFSAAKRFPRFLGVSRGFPTIFRPKLLAWER